MTALIKHIPSHNRLMIKELNPLLSCGLCRGYLIDATTLIECLHVFCRACILRHFENKLKCPTCNLVYKKKSYPYFRSDTTIQALVYKIVPGLYNKEIQRREDFYRSTGARAGSSCSEDSVLADLNEEQEWQIPSPHGDAYQFLSPDDAISLSLEYYQPHLDGVDKKSRSAALQNCSSLSESDNKAHTCDNNCNCVNTKDVNKIDSVQQNLCEDPNGVATDSTNVCDEPQDKKKCDRRYLRCPAAVTMSLLQKFVRMKHALSTEHRVDIIYEGEVLPNYFTLMDVAYTFKWQRIKPIRFFYRIFTPVKIQPIKIITTSSGKRKQLQVVPAKSHHSSETKPQTSADITKLDIDDQTHRNKETLMTNLQLQSITKPPTIFTSRSQRPDELIKQQQQKHESAQCVYEYEEPDKEEIRAFAEKRDLEWALQKQLDEAKEQYRLSKKRKKSKHKNNVLYKKRKLHAEITSNDSSHKEESLKLKVKLTQPNGYKHKHHRSSQVHDTLPQRELSSKEKLLQMRQVRHKHIPKSEHVKPVSEINDKQPPEEAKPEPPLKTEPVTPSKTLRNDVSKTNATKEHLPKLPTVHIERNVQTEHQAQQTFLKTFQSYTEKHAQRNGLPQSQPGSGEKTSVSNAQVPKSLERKIASLHQQSSTIPKPKPEQKVNNAKAPLILNSQFSTGFTVSKIESGMKRKSNMDLERQKLQDKRPSLEITLINPSDEVKTNAKRPLPATIPLDKIRSMNRALGVSIVQQNSETTALDLSKPNKSPDALHKPSEAPAKLLNGLSCVPGRTPDKNMQLSNLQMLSKVATEHPSINNKRPQMPSLNTLKIPNPNVNLKTANLAKLPKLNEINKTQFRLPNPLRNMRPNQNQNIRNIPNPSLLVRQQNQNRMNSLSNTPSTETKQNHTSTKEDNEKHVSEDNKAIKQQTVDTPNSLVATS